MKNQNQNLIELVKLPNGLKFGKYPVTFRQWISVENEISTHRPLDRPKVNVSWIEVQEFLEKTGNQYRLPTSSEWEYACRAGSKSLYSFGNDRFDLAKHAWFHENSNYQSHPVGQKLPNAWGLYDMHGHVWEWCQDKVDTRERVARGGSWSSDHTVCRSDYSTSFSETKAAIVLGFRLVLNS